MNKRNIIIALFVITTLGSCNLIKPFFIKNSKKEERKDKRVERKIERKENKIEKKLEKVEELKNNIVKNDSVPSTKRDSLVVKLLDTVSANRMIDAKKVYYATFQSKAKMHFESDKDKQNFSINFRLRKDSVIWASINAPIIGEVARAIITPDSVKAIERINKKLFLYSYNDIQKLINLEVDFATLQELIVGNAIALKGDIKELKVLGLLSSILIKGYDYTNQLTYNSADSSLHQLQLQTQRPSSSSSLLIALSQYQWMEGRYLSTQRQYNILDIKGAIQLDMDINKAEFDKIIDYPFTIPKNYKLQN